MFLGELDVDVVCVVEWFHDDEIFSITFFFTSQKFQNDHRLFFTLVLAHVFSLERHKIVWCLALCTRLLLYQLGSFQNQDTACRNERPTSGRCVRRRSTRKRNQRNNSRRSTNQELEFGSRCNVFLSKEEQKLLMKIKKKLNTFLFGSRMNTLSMLFKIEKRLSHLVFWNCGKVFRIFDPWKKKVIGDWCTLHVRLLSLGDVNITNRTYWVREWAIEWFWTFLSTLLLVSWIAAIHLKGSSKVIINKHYISM